jgi:hypothetical protein
VSGTVFPVLHVLGYCALAVLATEATIRRVKHVSQSKRVESAEERMARIARLEIATGVGLHVGRDWLMERPIEAMTEGMQRLAEEGNCSVERKCWGCDKTYSPNDDSEYGRSIYGRLREDGRKVMRERLCASCFDGALTELERL